MVAKHRRRKTQIRKTKNGWCIANRNPEYNNPDTGQADCYALFPTLAEAQKAMKRFGPGHCFAPGKKIGTYALRTSGPCVRFDTQTGAPMLSGLRGRKRKKSAKRR